MNGRDLSTFISVTGQAILDNVTRYRDQRNMRTESSGCTANQPALSSSQCAIKDFYPSLYLQADSQQATALPLFPLKRNQDDLDWVGFINFY